MVDSEHRKTRASSRRVSTSGRASRRARASFVMNETYRLRAARPRVLPRFGAADRRRELPARRCSLSSSRRWMRSSMASTGDARAAARSSARATFTNDPSASRRCRAVPVRSRRWNPWSQSLASALNGGGRRPRSRARGLCPSCRPSSVSFPFPSLSSSSSSLCSSTAWGQRRPSGGLRSRLQGSAGLLVAGVRVGCARDDVDGVVGGARLLGRSALDSGGRRVFGDCGLLHRGRNADACAMASHRRPGSD